MRRIATMLLAFAGCGTVAAVADDPRSPSGARVGVDQSSAVSHAPAGGRVQMRRDAAGRVTFFNEPPPPLARKSVGHSGGRASRYEHLIREHARRQGLDPDLVRAVIQVESAFDPRARSHKGAQGLMQLMPGTARELGVEHAFDPDENIRGGTTYLGRMLERFDGSLKLALAAYNAGPSAVERYGSIPPYKETTRYVRKVLSAYRGPGAAESISDVVETRQTEGRKVRFERRGGRVYLVTD